GAATGRRRRSRGARTCACANTARTRGARTTESRRCCRAAKRQASDVAPAHRSIPLRLDLAGLFVGGDAVEDAVVDQNVGIRYAADGTILVVERRRLPGHAVQVVIAPLALHRRE